MLVPEVRLAEMLGPPAYRQSSGNELLRQQPRQDGRKGG
jgi:hypothetical protein